MRAIMLLFMMTFTPQSSAKEIGPCPDADNWTACAAQEAINQALGGAMLPVSPPLLKMKKEY